MRTSGVFGASRLALRARRARLAVLLAALALLLSAAPPAMAGVPFRFNIYIGNCGASGYGPSNDSFTVTLKNAEGRVKGSSPASSDGTGYWNTDNCLGQDIEIGDKITADDGSVHRTFTVPVLSISGDRQTDRVTGYGPHNASLALTLYDCITFSCQNVKALGVSTDGTGKFQHDFTPAHDVKGGDYASVYWTSPHNDYVSTYSYFAYLNITLGRSDFWGYTKPNQVSSVSLKNGSTVKGTAHGVGDPHNGYFSADFRRANGSPGLPDVGNKVLPSFGPAFTLANVTAVGHPATEMVTGTCPANRAFEAYAHDPTYPYRADGYAYTDGTASPTGHVSANMTTNYPSFNLMHGDEVVLSCKLGSGDIEAFSVFVP